MRRLVILLMSLALLVACSLTTSAKPTSPPPPTSALPFYTPSPAPSDSKNDWVTVMDGLEKREFHIGVKFTPQAFNIFVLRIDPQKTVLRVHYTPQEWFTTRDWANQLDGALALVNANFFTATGDAVGLVVADGQSYGYSFDGYGGMLEITHHNIVRVRSLVSEPYQNEQYLQAIQGFPLLIERGGQPASTGAGFDDLARRTMIAQDTQGHILIMVTSLGQISLRNAQKWLSETAELDIDIAFGLDGGKSSGLYVDDPSGEIFFNSIEPVPVILAVYSR